MITSGIRIGTAAITSRGLKTADAISIVDWIDQAITHRDDDHALSQIKATVNNFMGQFSLYPYL
jgi:glycine hydroxymethyltransferase